VEFVAGTAMDFHLDPIRVVEADTGCIGRTSSAAPGGRSFWLALLGAVLLLVVFRRKGARAGVTALLSLCSAASMAAADDAPAAPRFDLDSPDWARLIGEAGADEAERDASADFLLYSRPEKRREPWFSGGVFAGMLFMNMDFEAQGADLVQREASGSGLMVFGLNAFFIPHPDLFVGLEVETAVGGDVTMFGAGPVVEWRFAHDNPAGGGRSDMEHFARAGVLYEQLEVDKSDFGDFDPAIGFRIGYEFRAWLGGSWTLKIGAEYRYAVWNYNGDVVDGDEEIGGHGFFLSIGVGFGG
jgi:hypothetical protein